MTHESPVTDLIFRIHHTMLPVADLQRSMTFYTRLFGMSVMGRRSDADRKVEVGHVGYGDRATQPSLELICRSFARSWRRRASNLNNR